MITDYSKQQILIEAYKFNIPINIVGAGAGGSWLAFFLLKMGFKNIHIYDYDVIEEHNIPNQLFREKDIGTPKVDAMLDIYKTFFTDGQDERLKIHNEKITEDNAIKLRGVVFNCVDTMSGRKMIYEQCYKYGQCEVLLESRLSVFGAYIYTLAKNGSSFILEYEKTLYADEEAEVSACGTSQTALPSAVATASIMIMQMIKWWKGEEFNNELMYNLPDLDVIKR